MFDRLGRKDDETPFVVEWFVKNDISVWSATEGQQRFDTHVDKLMNYIRYWQASGESLKTSQRIKTRFEQLTREGIYHGGSAPFGYCLEKRGRTNKKGYEIGDLAVDPAEAEVVKLIFQKCIYEGYGAQRTAQFLNQQGFIKRGNDFTNTSIQRILGNIQYTGVLKSGDIVSEIFPHLQIIDPDTFQQAQKVIHSRLRPRGNVPFSTKGKSLLNGLVFCGTCGAKLNRSTGGSGSVSYRCYNKFRHPDRCNGQSTYKAEIIDNAVNELIITLFREIRSISVTDLRSNSQKQFILQKQNALLEVQNAKQAAEKELDTLKAEVLNAIRGTSAFSPALLNDMIEKKASELTALCSNEQAISDTIQDMERELKELEKQNKQFFSWAEAYSTSTLEARRMVVFQLIQKIRVFHSHRMEIDFTVSFDQFLSCCNLKVNKSTFFPE